jgi:hypothetical protein
VKVQREEGSEGEEGSERAIGGMKREEERRKREETMWTLFPLSIPYFSFSLALPPLALPPSLRPSLPLALALNAPFLCQGMVSGLREQRRWPGRCRSTGDLRTFASQVSYTFVDSCLGTSTQHSNSKQSVFYTPPSLPFPSPLPSPLPSLIPTPLNTPLPSPLSFSPSWPIPLLVAGVEHRERHAPASQHSHTSPG